MSDTVTQHVHGIITGALAAIVTSLSIESFFVVGILVKLVSMVLAGVLGGVGGGIGSNLWAWIKSKLTCKKKE